MTMRLSTLLWFLTAGSAATATFNIDDAFYNRSMLILPREHEVIHLLYQLSTYNLFFIEADVKNGVTTYKGLYAATHLEGNTYKLVKNVLDNGKDLTFDNKRVFFGATDGIYEYNHEEERSEKYGTVTEDIRCIAKVKGSDILYILSENNKLFKVLHNGTRMVEVTSVVDAHEIVLDRANNLYYYSSDKKPWVVNGNVARKINGLPEKPSFIKFVKPSFKYSNEVMLQVDNELYRISSNGTSVKLDYNIVARPSAVSIDTTFFIWYSQGKNIYVKPYYFY